MYAVIEDGSRQYWVEVGLKLDVDYRETVSPGDELVFDRVLACRTSDAFHVGQPLLEDARVVARVIDHVKGPKIYVEKFKRRKNYRRRKGHRQRATRVLIERIEIGGTVIAGPVTVGAVETAAPQPEAAAEQPETTSTVAPEAGSPPPQEPSTEASAPSETPSEPAPPEGGEERAQSES